jgi:hypothetical protein
MRGEPTNPISAEPSRPQLAIAYDATTHRSRLLVLDARNPEHDPLYTGHLRHHVPQGFHGAITSRVAIPHRFLERKGRRPPLSAVTSGKRPQNAGKAGRPRTLSRPVEKWTTCAGRKVDHPGEVAEGVSGCGRSEGA